ncbi:MAG: radical SAM protein [Myxococcaceae bacterium]
MDGGPRHSATELAAAVDDQTSCICFFGGDPTPQLAHALVAARLARRRAVAKHRILRICFETNGAMQPAALRTMTDLVLESGGCIKFDLKAHHDNVHQALCGASNERTLENFAYLVGRRGERPEVPLAIATTPLVPGYVDVEEVSAIAGFIASLGKDIPYSLLAFFPCFYLSDLPHTSVQQADRCLTAARAAGLTRVHPCARELLGDAPDEAPKPRRRKRRAAPG